MNKIISIGQAAKMLGVHVQTLRNWEKSGKLKPDSISPGGTRRYNSDTIMRISGRELIQIEKDDRVTIAYARVSSQDQKEDLKRQAQVLELYCAEHGYRYELITDLGSGMNYYKKGLTSLINRILGDGVKRLVLTHKDRLLRFGAELIFSICEAKGVEVVIINKGEDKASFEEDLAKDVLEIITVFSARLYGSRSGKNRKIIEKLQESVK
ncbi:IS607 family transposase [Ruminobacter sp.]|jgi:predicted site-specific integrase-resolvase|uniref:IS607 family transposase n=1 Tax=Ruminobacter sp. TaxID=2774296 RepID=UPI003867A5AA